MVDDFGPDFDQEGNPLEEGESDRIKSEEERAARPRAEAGPDGAGAEAEEREEAGATA
jgi:F-type H+-transporting ATPase subunit alpha